MTVIRFPLERTPGHKTQRLARQVGEPLTKLQLDFAIDRLAVAAWRRRQGRPLDTSFRRDRLGRAQ